MYANFKWTETLYLIPGFLLLSLLLDEVFYSFNAKEVLILLHLDVMIRKYECGTHLFQMLLL